LTDHLRDQLNHADILLKEARKHVANDMTLTASLCLAQLRTHILTIENDLNKSFGTKDKTNAPA
jgi:hypothetical protein